MFRPLFIGDSVSAAGFRLGGASVQTPEPGDEMRLFREALDSSELIIITAEVASRIPESLIKSVQIGGSPLLLIVTDARHQQEAPDIAADLRRQLGMVEGHE
jgi:vacuolar-type H+-ATPase subunit F/Vma7